jgi:hypothetical protein
VSVLFADGRVIDAILVLVALEALALLLHHRLTGRGPAPASVLPMLLAGAGLMAALRAALSGAWPGWIALGLLVALGAHLADLAGRWRTGR